MSTIPGFEDIFRYAQANGCKVTIKSNFSYAESEGTVTFKVRKVGTVLSDQKVYGVYNISKLSDPTWMRKIVEDMVLQINLWDDSILVERGLKKVSDLAPYIAKMS